MSGERQARLLQRMRRSLISLRVQTPDPVVYRIPTHWYGLAIALMVLLVATVSTQAALMYREDVSALNVRTELVQQANLERTQVRAAALINFKSRPESLPEKAVAATIIESLPVADPIEAMHVMAKPVTPPSHKAKLTISSSQSERRLPYSVQEAFRRLERGRDDTALRWLAAHAQELRGSVEWQLFRDLSAVTRQPERYYQLGVLYGVLGERSKELQWLALAMADRKKSHHLRAYAIAADRNGLQRQALSAYRLYLKDSKAHGAEEIQARITALESS